MVRLAPGHAREIHARALFVGQRIDVRALENVERLATAPLMVRAGEQGSAVLFRYGAVVLFGVPALEELGFLKALEPLIGQRFAEPETEEVDIIIDREGDEHVNPGGTVSIHEASVERLQTIADILAKSVVLSHYEKRLGEVFDLIEPLAHELTRGEFRVSQGRHLLRQIGEVLLTQHTMVGRVEVTEPPELLWERPQLERLYARMRDEYELRERHRALTYKLELVSRTASTVLELIQDKRILRVEWSRSCSGCISCSWRPDDGRQGVSPRALWPWCPRPRGRAPGSSSRARR
jgi:uncharacterized Rmd1/YagE family protein